MKARILKTVLSGRRMMKLLIDGMFYQYGGAGGASLLHFTPPTQTIGYSLSNSQKTEYFCQTKLYLS